MNNTKLTKLEKCWILYDVGNSAFIMLVSTIIPVMQEYPKWIILPIGDMLLLSQQSW